MPSAKKAVDLAGGPRKVGSRIRRAPPPKPEKRLTAAELRERERTVVVGGILLFAVALCVIMVAAGQWGGWSPSHVQLVINAS
ncbi:hypothetical protein GCM10022211_03560 [Sphingomonas humi]|uniref:Cell division protein FtsQ n=2 Tax=Sphingomonas humi TaxID=335630 RepID=A0ABP7RH48_9SPHN